MERLTKRAQFRRTAGGAKWTSDAFVLQARARDDAGTVADECAARFGFTASRRVGNAVARNRARRRLKEAARSVLAPAARAGHDYVLIARAVATSFPFGQMLDDLGRAIEMVHRKLDGRRRDRPAAERRPTGHQASETGAV